MSDIKLSRKGLEEALLLAEETLKNIELSSAPLSIVMLKASRLARIVGDAKHQIAFEYEASGYPSSEDGVPPSAFEAGRLAGRVHKKKDENGKEVERINVSAVETIEGHITTMRLALEAAKDASVSVSSANPNQYVWNPTGNAAERTKLQNNIFDYSKTLAQRRAFVHRYISVTYDDLRFASITDDIFARMRAFVDASISKTVPSSVQKFNSVYDNLISDNPEDWANAVHSCRRILQDLADAVFPASSEPRVKGSGSKAKTIHLGADNYINRLVCFMEDQSSSSRFRAIVGSTLAYVGERLDASFQAAQKGSHSEISSKAEADRYVVYTYMLVADILLLQEETPSMADIETVSVEDGHIIEDSKVRRS